MDHDNGKNKYFQDSNDIYGNNVTLAKAFTKKSLVLKLKALFLNAGQNLSYVLLPSAFNI